MKTKFVFTLAVFAFFTIQCTSAQIDSTRKGHFVFGANLLDYTAGTIIEQDRNVSPYNNPITTTNYNIASISFNVSVGYFVSNRVCVGLNFGNLSDNFMQAYYGSGVGPSALAPSSFFFRYFLNEDDSSIASFFLEGAVGGNYNSISANSGTPVGIANLNANFNIVIDIHTIKHLDVQLRAGIAYSEYFFGSSSSSYSSPENISSPAFVSSLGLQYKL